MRHKPRPTLESRGRKRTRSRKWQSAYEKALKNYGSKSQAERIAWGAIDGVQTLKGKSSTRRRQGQS